MKGPYRLNTLSKTLHITDCCKNSKGNSDTILFFTTEDEVLAYAGSSFKWCEECRAWREKVIYDALTKKEEHTK